MKERRSVNNTFLKPKKAEYIRKSCKSSMLAGCPLHLKKRRGLKNDDELRTH